MYRWCKFASSHWLTRNEAALQEQTNNGLVVIQSRKRKRLRLEVSSSSRRSMQWLRDRFGGAIEQLPKDWRARFAARAETKPLRIGTRLVIRSARKVPGSKTRQLIVPAAGAFGTGEHETTAMCLRLLEQFSRKRPPGWSMLDAGTGTGILALTAHCFGAGDVIGIDNDPHAIAIAKSNAQLNRINCVRFQIADATKFKPRRKFDIIASNLFSELLIKMIPSWKQQLNAMGVLILSGILRAQEAEVGRAIRRLNLAIQEDRRHGKWIALLAGEPPRPAGKAG